MVCFHVPASYVDKYPQTNWNDRPGGKDTALWFQKPISPRTKLFEPIPYARPLSRCTARSVGSPDRAGRQRNATTLIVTAGPWCLHQMLLFWASRNFLTTGQGPMLCANEFQIGRLHCACVRKVPRFMVGVGARKKRHTEKGRKKQ